MSPISSSCDTKNGDCMFRGPVFSMGQSTLSVPMKLFALNRERLCDSLRSIKDVPEDAVVILKGGNSVSLYSSDVEYNVFRQEAFFFWAFGVTEPGFYGAIQVSTGSTFLFAPKFPDAYEVWMGRLHTLEQYEAKYAVDKVFYKTEAKCDNNGNQNDASVPGDQESIMVEESLEEDEAPQEPRNKLSPAGMCPKPECPEECEEEEPKEEECKKAKAKKPKKSQKSGCKDKKSGGGEKDHDHPCVCDIRKKRKSLSLPEIYQKFYGVCPKKKSDICKDEEGKGGCDEKKRAFGNKGCENLNKLLAVGCDREKEKEKESDEECEKKKTINWKKAPIFPVKGTKTTEKREKMGKWKCGFQVAESDDILDKLKKKQEASEKGALPDNAASLKLKCDPTAGKPKPKEDPKKQKKKVVDPCAKVTSQKK